MWLDLISYGELYCSEYEFECLMFAEDILKAYNDADKKVPLVFVVVYWTLELFLEDIQNTFIEFSG